MDADKGREISLRAGSICNDTILEASDDAHHGLRYLLLRLEVAGLKDADREQLGALARLIQEPVDGAAVTKAVEGIKSRTSAAPLAIAIADIVAAAPVARMKMTLLGALFGAYLGVDLPIEVAGFDPQDPTTGVLGAIAGTIAVSTNSILQEELIANQWREFIDTTLTSD